MSVTTAMIASMVAGFVLLSSVAAPASARSFHTSGAGTRFVSSTHRPPVVQPQMRKSCVRIRTRQIMANLGHDWDLAVQEAMLICG